MKTNGCWQISGWRRPSVSNTVFDFNHNASKSGTNYIKYANHQNSLVNALIMRYWIRTILLVVLDSYNICLFSYTSQENPSVIRPLKTPNFYGGVKSKSICPTSYQQTSIKMKDADILILKFYLYRNLNVVVVYFSLWIQRKSLYIMDCMEVAYSALDMVHLI